MGEDINTLGPPVSTPLNPSQFFYRLSMAVGSCSENTRYPSSNSLQVILYRNFPAIFNIFCPDFSHFPFKFSHQIFSNKNKIVTKTKNMFILIRFPKTNWVTYRLGPNSDTVCNNASRPANTSFLHLYCIIIYINATIIIYFFTAI